MIGVDSSVDSRLLLHVLRLGQNSRTVGDFAISGKTCLRFCLAQEYLVSRLSSDRTEWIYTDSINRPPGVLLLPSITS